MIWTKDFKEVAFGLDEGVGVGAVDDEDDTVGAAGERFANETEVLESWAAEQVGLEFLVFKSAEVEADGAAVDFGGDGVVGDLFDERSFADALRSNDQKFQMPHGATPQ